MYKTMHILKSVRKPDLTKSFNIDYQLASVSNKPCYEIMSLSHLSASFNSDDRRRRKKLYIVTCILLLLPSDIVGGSHYTDKISTLLSEYM